MDAYTGRDPGDYPRSSMVFLKTSACIEHLRAVIFSSFPYIYPIRRELVLGTRNRR